MPMMLRRCPSADRWRSPRVAQQVAAVPRDRRQLRCARVLRIDHCAQIAAGAHGEPAGLLQQLFAVTHPDHQRVDPAQEAQHAGQACDLGSLAGPLGAQLGIRQGPLDRRHQAQQVVLQDVVGGTRQQRRDRALLADGSRDEYERRPPARVRG